MGKESDSFMTMKEAEELLGVSRTTFYRLRLTYDVPEYRMRGKIMFKRGELTEWAKRLKSVG